MWNEVWKKGVENVDINGTIVQSCSVMRVHVMKYPIKHTIAGVWLYWQGEALEENVVWYYSGTQFYQISFGRPQDD